MTDVGKALAERRAGAPASRTGKTVGDFLDDEREAFARALPNAISADRFARLVLTECRKTPKLLECTPASLVGAAMSAAQLGLEPGPLQHSYLIPRRGKGGVWEVQFQIGYRGIIDLALRAGAIVDAHVVYERDHFDFAYGTERFLRHRPARTERGEAVWSYAVAEVRNAGKPFMVLSIEEVDRRRRRSSAPDSPAWKNDWAAMARKTSVRALAPYLPQTPEFASAMRLDETVRTDFTSALDEHEPVIDAEGEEVPPPADGGAATASDGEAAPPDADDPTRPM